MLEYELRVYIYRLTSEGISLGVPELSAAVMAMRAAVGGPRLRRRRVHDSLVK
jgi:hypothetical protein